MKNELNESENQTQNSENRAIDDIQEFAVTQSPDNLFNRNCSVCKSGLIDEIHALRTNHTLVETAQLIKEQFGVELSKDALSRHFMH
jgi:hypothetical protein